MNRTTYQFNSALDRAVLKPVATAYRDYVPQFVRTGVSNLLDNLGYPTVIVNDLLQGKVVDGLKDTGRLLLNSTLGLGGLFDPASTIGLARNDEDFGQTLGKWGVPAGPYLVIPLMGPSTLRDTPTRYVDAQTSLVELLEHDVAWLDEDGVVYGLVTLSVINTRAELLQLEGVLSRAYDEYAFVRDSWLRRREYQVRDGDVPDEEPIEEFPMDDEEDPASQPDEQPEGSDSPQSPEMESPAQPGSSAPPPQDPPAPQDDRQQPPST